MHYNAQMSGGEVGGEMSVAGEGDVRILIQDYKSLCVAVVICGSLVNTQTHTQTAFDRLYY